MGYFDAQTGLLPLPVPHGLALWPVGAGWMLTWAAPPTSVDQALVACGVEPYQERAVVAADTCRWMLPDTDLNQWTLAWLRDGVRGPWAKPIQVHEKTISQPQTARCPLCQHPLMFDTIWWRCSGRCGTNWLRDTAGNFFDPRSCAWGICLCCVPPQPLQKAEQGVVCPQTSLSYVLNGLGHPQQIANLPYGACQCCVPPRPLEQHEQTVICPGSPQTRYVQTETGWCMSSHKIAAHVSLDAIDAALKQNSANWTLYGLFDVD